RLPPFPTDGGNDDPDRRFPTQLRRLDGGSVIRPRMPGKGFGDLRLKLLRPSRLVPGRDPDHGGPTRRAVDAEPVAAPADRGIGSHVSKSGQLRAEQLDPELAERVLENRTRRIAGE